MVYAVVGSRGFDDYEKVKTVLDEHKSKITKYVSGGAIGPDSLGERYANENGIPTVIYKPDWKKYGRAAGMIRNEYIVNDADVVIAFWDGKSKGTKNSINRAKKQKKKLIVIRTDDNCQQTSFWENLM